jgi:hypothetical protein
VLDGRIFVFGGEAPSGTFSEVEAYDPESNGCSRFVRMPTARHGWGPLWWVDGSMSSLAELRLAAPPRPPLRSSRPEAWLAHHRGDRDVGNAAV